MRQHEVAMAVGYLMRKLVRTRPQEGASSFHGSMAMFPAQNLKPSPSSSGCFRPAKLWPDNRVSSPPDMTYVGLDDKSA